MDWNLGTAARTLWQEARNQNLAGQQAVAHAIINRRNDGRWGNSFDEVCRSQYKGIFQFSGWNRTDPNRIPAERLADDDPSLVKFAAMITTAENEPDPTGGATHYYNPKIDPTPPDWVPGAIFCGQFDEQLFYRGVK